LSQLVHLPRKFLSRSPQELAGWREHGSLSRAHEQPRSQPFLERTDPTAERGLGYTPYRCRARKRPLLGQGKEIFKPS